MVKKLLGFFIMLLISITGVLGVISIDIQGKVLDYTVYSEEVIFSYNCGDVIYFNFPNSVTNIHYENNTIISNLDKFIISDCNNYTKIIYDLDIIQKISSEERIERKFSNLDKFNYSYSIIMPIYFKLNENETVPKNYIVNYSQDSKIIHFSKNDVYLIYYFPEEPEKNSISVGKFIEEIQEPLVFLLFLISFIIGFVVAYFIFKKSISKVFLEHVPSYILSKEEKLILDVIEKNPGINQKLIGKELDFSKARVSAFVNDLEQKGLIKRERFGRTFKVYLNKKIV